MKKFTRAFLALVAILVVFVVYQVALFPEQLRNESFGAAFFPLWLSGLMAFLIAVIWLENRKAKDEPLNFDMQKLRLPLYFIAAALIFAIILPYGGFIFCAVLFLTVGMRLCTVRWRTSLICSVLMTTGVYLVFKTLLKVPLPAGALWENFI